MLQPNLNNDERLPSQGKHSRKILIWHKPEEEEEASQPVAFVLVTSEVQIAETSMLMIDSFAACIEPAGSTIARHTAKFTANLPKSFFSLLSANLGQTWLG